MDRDILLFEKMNEIYDKKISFMIESLDTQMKINMLEAQYKVITESGTKEDFEYLYMEAKEETKEKKKGIFDGIIEWVKKIKDKIVDFFTKKKIKKQINALPDTVGIDKAHDEHFSKFKKFHSWVVRPINLFKQKKYGEMKTEIVNNFKNIALITGGITFSHVYIKIRKGVLIDRADWVCDTFKVDCDDILKLCKVNDGDSSGIKILKELVSSISQVVSKALQYIAIIPSAVVTDLALCGAVGAVSGKMIGTGIGRIKAEINKA